MTVKRKEKSTWKTEETPKVVKDKQEAKVKGNKNRVRILNTVFQQLITLR